MRLNTAQQSAVDYIDGPCLVLAGAGSGKTRVITTKIVKLIRKVGINPQNICAVTFTNKAAAEMRERVGAELDSESAKKISISTFHSLGLNILKIEHEYLNLGSNFSLFDQNDSEKVIYDIARERYPQLLLNTSAKNAINDIASQISSWKGKLLAPEDLANSPVVSLYSDYRNYLDACNAVDFDDLIFLTAKLLINNDTVRNRWQNIFKYILVDEYQDTNETQYRLLRILTAKHNRFTVVGDDDQSIYSWRGARPENINILAQDYPDLKVIKLEQNYRCTKHILNCANAVISHNSHIFDKTLFTNLEEGAPVKIIEVRNEIDEGERIASEILSHQFRHGTSWNEYAVLYRSNFQSRFVENACVLARIPVSVAGGQGFFEQTEIKDMMAWFRLICNPDDDMAFLRVINIPRRGIGPETIAVLAAASKENDASLYQNALNSAVTNSLKPSQMRALSSFILLLTSLREKIIYCPDEYPPIDEIIENIDYESYLNASTDSKVARDYKIRNVHMLEKWLKNLLDKYISTPSYAFSAAIDSLNVREMLERGDKSSDNDAVQLMTLHAAKGLEFHYVYLIGMEDGLLPHHTSLEQPGGLDEERRLAYVGVTRAQRELTISYCNHRGGSNSEKDGKCVPSRFLNEMPEDDLQLDFEVSQLRSGKKKPAPQKEESESDIDRILRILEGGE
ncbi:MAG TPA: ATP-dependent DNA helicase Rep [Succinivibrionaceae bacterium]|nr:ATP-dependent DNA helicase Rep [Succinivibrionaceae bacterium]